MSELGKDLIIYVNRRKFDEGDGVKSRMTGGEIALLVDVPPDNAVVRRDGRGAEKDGEDEKDGLDKKDGQDEKDGEEKQNDEDKKDGDDKKEIGQDEVVEVRYGDHFLVTRRVVEGG